MGGRDRWAITTAKVGATHMASTTTRSPISDYEDEIVVDTIPMSYEEYLAWAEGDVHRRGEWADGEVIPFMTTSARHQRIHTFLFGLLINYLDLRQVGRVYSQTFELRSRPGAAREPDLLVVLDEHRDRVKEVRVEGAADPVIEIISPDSVTRDRRTKLDEYAKTGIPEYWIVDPREGHERIEVLVLEPDGRYRRLEADSDGRLRSTVLPGIWVDPVWLFGDELPSVVRLSMGMAEAAPPPENR